MKTHTLGFIFNSNFSKVLLVEKQRPDWQKGKLNGIGGKIESGEESLDCIVREVWEETGLKTKKEDWIYLGKMESSGWLVDIYTSLHHGELGDASTITDEKIDWFDPKNLPEKVLTNIHWLVPLAIDKLKHNEFKLCSVHC